MRSPACWPIFLCWVRVLGARILHDRISGTGPTCIVCTAGVLLAAKLLLHNAGSVPPTLSISTAPLIPPPRRCTVRTALRISLPAAARLPLLYGPRCWADRASLGLPSRSSHALPPAHRPREHPDFHQPGRCLQLYTLSTAISHLSCRSSSCFSSALAEEHHGACGADNPYPGGYSAFLRFRLLGFSCGGCPCLLLLLLWS